MNFFYDQPSPISIRHNSKFSFNDIESVFEPLFSSYYGIEGLQAMISSLDHIWGVYDKQIDRYIACALVQSHDEDDVLYIKLFGVENKSQGLGIGTRLLEAIKTWGWRKRYFAIILHTQVNNHPAIGLYEKVGFRKQFYLRDFFQSTRVFSFIQHHNSDAHQMILYL